MQFNLGPLNIGNVGKVVNLVKKPSRSKFGKGTLALVLIFGISSIILGTLGILNGQISSDWKSTEGTISGIKTDYKSGDTVYSPEVTYSVDGKSFIASTKSMTPSKPEIGKKQEVRYNPSNPSEGQVPESGSTLFILYLFPIIGVATTIFAIIAYRKSSARDKSIDSLKNSGAKITGMITEIKKLGTGTDSRGSTAKITVRAIDADGNVRDYESDTIVGGALAILDFQRNPTALDVYVDPKDPGNYFVDVDNLPQLTADKIASTIKDIGSLLPNKNNPLDNPPDQTPLSTAGNPAGPTPLMNFLAPTSPTAPETPAPILGSAPAPTPDLTTELPAVQTPDIATAPETAMPEFTMPAPQPTPADTLPELSPSPAPIDHNFGVDSSVTPPNLNQPFEPLAELNAETLNTPTPVADSPVQSVQAPAQSIYPEPQTTAPALNNNPIAPMTSATPPVAPVAPIEPVAPVVPEPIQQPTPPVQPVAPAPVAPPTPAPIVNTPQISIPERNHTVQPAPRPDQNLGR